MSVTSARRSLEDRVTEEPDGVSRHGGHRSGAPYGPGPRAQTRGGSTTARTRPIARPAGRLAGERVGERVPVGRVHERAPVGRDRTPARRRRDVERRERVDVAAARASSPASSASAPNGGYASVRRYSISAVGDERGLARAPAPARPRGRGCGSARAAGSRAAAGRRAAARRASTASAPAPRRGSAARAAPGRDRGTRRAPGRRRRTAARCSTASVPMTMSASGTSAVAVSTSTTRAPGTSASSSSRTRVTPGAQHPQLRRAALGAHERSLVAAVPAQQVLARRAHEQPEPAPPVQHADRGAVRRGAARWRAPPRAGPDPGGSSRRSTTCTRGQPPRLDVGRRRVDRVGSAGGDDRLDRRRRRAHRRTARRRARGALARARRARATSASVPPAAPRRRRRRRSRRARSGTGASAAIRPPTTTQSPCGRPPPTLGARRVGLERVQQRDRRGPGRAQVRTRARGNVPRRRRTRSSSPSVGAQRRHLGPPVEQRRLPDHPHANRPSRAIGLRCASSSTPVRRRVRAATRFGADADRRTATRGPAHRHAIHSVERDDVGGGPADTTASDVEQRRRSSIRLDVVRDDPAAHPPPVQRDAHDRADPHQRARARREPSSRRRDRPR